MCNSSQGRDFIERRRKLVKIEENTDIINVRVSSMFVYTILF